MTDSLVEVPLQLLVRVVDEQLLQAVGVEVLEAIDVQHADESPCVTVDRKHGKVNGIGSEQVKRSRVYRC